MWLKLNVLDFSDAGIGVFFSKLTKEKLDEVSLGKVVERRGSGLGGRLFLDRGFDHMELRVGSRSIDYCLGDEGLGLHLDGGHHLGSIHLVHSLGSRSHDLRRSVQVFLSSRSSDVGELFLGFEESLDLL